MSSDADLRWTTVGYVLCVPTALYWAASFGVLLVRAYVPAFAALAEYGGRQPEGGIGVAANSPSAPPQRRRHWLHAIVNMVKRSFLGRCRMSRQDAFTCFYLSGLIASGVLWGMCPWPWPAPLCLFGFHCAVRLTECILTRSPRVTGEDDVTLFAAVAGCSFYVFAAVSSCPFCTNCRSRNAALTVPAVLVYMSVCVVQVHCHRVLARLRASPQFLHMPSQQADAVCRTGTTATRMDGKIWRYHFPHVWPFTCVQEPHYLAEVLLYTVQAIMLWHTWPHERRSIVEAALTMSVTLVSWGVLAFTVVNLGMTAAQHRRFWTHVNTERASLARGHNDGAAAVPAPERLPRWVLIPGVY